MATDIPYRTRIVVRRPPRDRHFNGTVLMEWQNVTAGVAVSRQHAVVVDGHAPSKTGSPTFIVGSAPTRVAPEPVFQVLSETDVRTPVRARLDSDVFRRWEVAG